MRRGLTGSPCAVTARTPTSSPPSAHRNAVTACGAYMNLRGSTHFANEICVQLAGARLLASGPLAWLQSGLPQALDARWGAHTAARCGFQRPRRSCSRLR